MKKSCYFLSDLHLLSRRSHARLLNGQIQATVSRAHTVVLGGDIFDFKWSTLPTLTESIGSSISWLETLMAANRHCVVHYMLGNHDAHPQFIDALDRLSQRSSHQLYWHPYLLRLQDRVFLHGDILDGDANHDALAARRQAHGTTVASSRMSHALYDAVVQARLHRMAVHVVKRRRTVLKKLTRYLVQHEHGPAQGVRHVYFGHIHRELHGVEFGGLRFHNGGASIKGLRFRIVDATATSTSG